MTNVIILLLFILVCTILVVGAMFVSEGKYNKDEHKDN